MMVLLAGWERMAHALVSTFSGTPASKLVSKLETIFQKG